MHDVEFAELMRRELHLAAAVQRSMLPISLPLVPGYSFHAWWQPALEVGGDHYDIHALPTGEILVVVADVSGKGLAAAMGMSSLAAMIPLLLQQCQVDLTTFVGVLNKSVGRWASRVDRFVTLIAVVLDPARHWLKVVNAASSGSALIRRHDGSIKELCSVQKADFPLGVMDGLPYQAAQVSLEQGDCVIIATDGITNTVNASGEQYGTTRLLDVLAHTTPPAGKLGEAIRESITAFADTARVQDDVAMVCFARE